ncbi:hypothetical protein GCM10023094_11190 [Rhodococcus olei]|uniref:SsuA/THI5-like domain-containing protein n=1 Tax=Rhodococcus olei TaxID=2161675 RepID=A0ABP8NY85_9NOCA
MEFSFSPKWGKLRTVAVSLVVASALVTSACGSGDTGSQDDLKVTAAILPAYQNLAMKVGVVQGFFKNHGLDVNLIDNTDPAAQLSAMGNQFDIIPSSGSYLLNAAQKGLDATIVNNQSESTTESPAALLVTQKPINNYADLKGATIGVPLLTSYSGASLTYLMQKAGLTSDDYKLVAVPYAEQLDQFKAGRIQAAMSATPFTEGLKSAGFAVSDADIFSEAVHAAAGSDTIRFSPNFNLATTEWVKNNPKEVEAWRAGIEDSIEWLKANPAEGKKILVEWTKMPPQMADLANPPAFEMDIDPAQFDAIWNVMNVAGLAKGNYPGDNIKVFAANNR